VPYAPSLYLQASHLLPACPLYNYITYFYTCACAHTHTHTHTHTNAHAHKPTRLHTHTHTHARTHTQMHMHTNKHACTHTHTQVLTLVDTRAHPLLMHLTQAFEKTGLGSRIANMFVAAAGSSTLGMSFSLVAAEMLIAPGMPSCTARAGMLMPVCTRVCMGMRACRRACMCVFCLCRLFSKSLPDQYNGTAHTHTHAHTCTHSQHANTHISTNSYCCLDLRSSWHCYTCCVTASDP